jgi:hypothetical protein
MNSGPLWTEHMPAARVGSSHRPGFPTVGRVEPSLDPDGKGFVDELVDQVHHPEFPSIVGPLFDEVIGPDVMGHCTYSAPVHGFERVEHNRLFLAAHWQRTERATGHADGKRADALNQRR